MFFLRKYVTFVADFVMKRKIWERNSTGLVYLPPYI